ncbi:MAG: 7-cyano-7-deazaguanine synthase [Deltaproteobacteria bacterium]|nr:7-cyano-7-deazaguanine synthase [Deltaproteobacteria bacterium]
MTKRKAHAAVLFSGGTDSTLAAAQMLDECDKVTLLTFDPGYLLFLDNTKVHAEALQERFGADRVEHRIIDIRHFIKDILGVDVGADLREYGFNMSSLVCLGCRLSMHAFAIYWCLQNEVPYLADGSIRAQSTIPEQMESVIRRNRRFYSQEYGIRHFSPIYEESESDQRLDELGITGKKKLKRQFILFDTQATCVFGVPADVYGRLFYGKLVGKTRELDSEQYCAEKYPVMQDVILKAIEEHGIDVPTAAERLREIRREDGDLGESQGPGGEAAFDNALNPEIAAR